MATPHETTGGTGRGTTVIAVQASVAVGSSPAAVLEDFTITNDAGPVSAVPHTVAVSATANTISYTLVTVATNAHGVIITPASDNTIQLWLSNEAGTAGSGGVPTYGIKLSKTMPHIYTFDLGAVTAFYIKSTGVNLATDISVNLTWM